LTTFTFSDHLPDERGASLRKKFTTTIKARKFEGVVVDRIGTSPSFLGAEEKAKA
jgi:hypothetical protein